MKNNKVPLIAGVVVVVIVVAGVVLLMHDNKKTPSMNMDMSKSSSSSSSSNTSKPVAANAVSIDNFAFDSNNITVKVGTTVTWTNKDSVAHTVTADSPSSDAPASGDIANGQTYSFTFNKAGTYAYHCQIHPDMHGTVVVTE